MLAGGVTASLTVMTNQTRRTAVSSFFSFITTEQTSFCALSLCLYNVFHLCLYDYVSLSLDDSCLFARKTSQPLKLKGICVCVCFFSLQPHPCAQLTSSAVELDAVSGCHGDAMVRMTARTAAMKRAVRKPVRLWLLSFQKAKYNTSFNRSHDNGSEQSRSTDKLSLFYLFIFSVVNHSCFQTID